MSILKINGGKELSGELSIGGSKNAVLPIICATLLTEEECVLKNVPDILDVHNLLKILEKIGSKAKFENHTIVIDNSGLNSSAPDAELTKKLRGSILLLGSLLGRFGKVTLPLPGGDAIGRRPVDTHIFALQDLGAEVKQNGFLEVTAGKLVGAEVILREMSVTATENAIMAAVKAKGTTVLKLAATEPHVQDLCRMLVGMGAKIQGIGTHTLVIDGVDKLHGHEHSIIFDNEVTCSFINLAAATKSEVEIKNIQTDYLSSAMVLFREMNVNFEINKERTSILIKKPEGPYQAATIKANIYPGLLTDYIPPFSVLATQAEGRSIIHEWMYDGRLGYIHELAKMGANASIMDKHQAEIEGPTPLHGTNVSSLDVRSGMVMVIAALVAEGHSVLHDAHHIDRGYEHVDQMLKRLGADIERVEEE